MHWHMSYVWQPTWAVVQASWKDRAVPSEHVPSLVHSGHNEAWYEVSSSSSANSACMRSSFAVLALGHLMPRLHAPASMKPRWEHVLPHFDHSQPQVNYSDLINVINSTSGSATTLCTQPEDQFFAAIVDTDSIKDADACANACKTFSDDTTLVWVIIMLKLCKRKQQSCKTMCST